MSISIKKILAKIFKNQLITGSSVVMVGSLVGGFGNYLYHLFMGRMLGPGDYGSLASLISLTYLLSIPMGTLQLVIISFIPGLNRSNTVGAFFKKINKKILPLSIFSLFLLAIFSPLIASFLHLDSVWPLMIVASIFFINIFSTINQAFLQGLLRFSYIAVTSVFQVVIRLAIAVLLVYLGFKINGALFALLVAGICGYFLTLLPLRLFPKAGEETPKKAEVFTFAMPVFFSTLAFTSLYTSDIVLARHFLSSQEAGFYSALANLGKIIFFVSGPIVTVMFPMIAGKHAGGEKYGHLFNLSAALVSLICLGISLIYVFFPKLMVTLLYGKEYLPAASSLWLFALFLSFYTLSFLLTNYFLSVKKTKIVYSSVIAALLQIVLIFFYHQTTRQLVLVSIMINALLLGALLIYYLQNEGQKEKSSLRYYPGL
jgi:O-antigen/teichoic acid export membrane protein